MRVKGFNEWAEDLEEASIFQAIKIAGGKRIFRQEYEGAMKLYTQFRKRGDSVGSALHKAATTYRHVNERQLQKYIQALAR